LHSNRENKNEAGNEDITKASTSKSNQYLTNNISQVNTNTKEEERNKRTHNKRKKKAKARTNKEAWREKIT